MLAPAKVGPQIAEAYNCGWNGMSKRKKPADEAMFTRSAIFVCEGQVSQNGENSGFGSM